MYKRIIGTLALLTMGVLLFGCAGSADGLENTDRPEIENDTAKTAELKISFTPDPVPCVDGRWMWKIIISETNGVGVTLENIVYEICDGDGAQKTETIGSDWFEKLLPSGYLSPDDSTETNGNIGCKDNSYITYELEGTDDNGNKITTHARLDLLSAEEPVTESKAEEETEEVKEEIPEAAGIEISFDSNPVLCTDGMWKWKVILTEIDGTGVKLTGLVYNVYADNGVVDSRVYGSDWIEGWLPSGYLSAGNTASCGFGFPCQAVSHATYEFTGTNDNGKAVKAEARIDFQK